MTKNRNIIYVGLGIGACSPMLALVFGGRVLSLFSIAILLVFIDLIWSRGNIKNELLKSNSVNTLFKRWTAIAVMSAIWGAIYIGICEGEFLTPLKSIPKVLFYFVLFSLFARDSNVLVKLKLLLKGIKTGMLINLLWSVADALIFYATKISITNELFASYINATDMRLGMASIIDGVTIRSVAFNNDPATVGFFAIVMMCYYLYTNASKIWLFLPFLSAVSCLSFTALVGFLFVFVGWIFRNNIKSAILFVFCFSVLILGLFNYVGDNNGILGMIKTAVEAKADSKANEDNESTGMRVFYIKNFVEAISCQPTTLFIGTGYDTATYPYSCADSKNEYFSEASFFDMENTYIAVFFDLGLVGFLAYYLFYFKIWKKFRNFGPSNNDKNLFFIYAVTEGSLIADLFYHYILYSVIMLTSISAIFFYNFDRKNEDKSVDNSHSHL